MCGETTKEIKQTTRWYCSIMAFLLLVCTGTWWFSITWLDNVVTSNQPSIRFLLHLLCLINLLTCADQCIRTFSYHHLCRQMGHAQCTMDHAKFMLLNEIVFRSPCFFVGIVLMGTVQLYRHFVRTMNSFVQNNKESTRD